MSDGGMPQPPPGYRFRVEWPSEGEGRSRLVIRKRVPLTPFWREVGYCNVRWRAQGAPGEQREAMWAAMADEAAVAIAELEVVAAVEGRGPR